MLIIIQLSTSVPWVPILCSLPFYLCWLRVCIFLQVILIQWDCKSEMFKERKKRKDTWIDRLPFQVARGYSFSQGGEGKAMRR